MSGHPNHLSPVDILLQDYQRQQIQQEINTQYQALASEMRAEALSAVAKQKPIKRIVKQKDTSLENLIRQGLAKVIIPNKAINTNKKGKKQLKDTLSKTEYFKLTRNQQMDYDRKMATEFHKKGLGPYRSFKRQQPINKNKLFSLGDKLKSANATKVSIKPSTVNFLGAY